MRTRGHPHLISSPVKFTRRRARARAEAGGDAAPGPPTHFLRDNASGCEIRFAYKPFQPFQGLHRDVDYEGTGVELALVARIVHRRGGRIRAAAEPDRGATFQFVLGRSNG